MARGLLAVLVLLAPALTACGDEAPQAEEPPAASVRSPSPAPGETPGPGLPAVVPWDGEGFAPPVTLDLDGVEIGVRDLAEHPARATASVTVASASGRSVRIATRARRDCYAEGNLWFTAPDSDGHAATRLGAGPFTYDVELVLDGRTYHGLGEWPTGETEEIAPHVPLSWTPALPSYHG